MQLRVGRVASLQGHIVPPADKSLSHRALMFGAIAAGPSIVHNLLDSEDVHATEMALAALGAKIERPFGGHVEIVPREWASPTSDLDCGNSGTSIRLLAGLISSYPITATLTGDASLSRRPMKRVADPLRLMGARIEGETPPVRIEGGNLKGIDYETPVASAQIKSAILLAGLRAEGETWVREPHASRDHTERMLAATGVEVRRDPVRGVGVRPSQPEGFKFTVPADISSAAFWMVAAATCPDAMVSLAGVGVNPTRTGILDVFAQAGIAIQRTFERDELGEPVADLVVRTSPVLRPFSIDGELVPRLIDEIPVLSVLATQCSGVTAIRGARELRVKESDRIERMAEGLRAMGALVETYEDGMDIEGPVDLKGVTVDADGDHRIAMAFAIAGLIASGETVINGAKTISTSYPAFPEDLTRLSVM